MDRAALKPLPAPPASSDRDSDATQVIQRLTWVYPYDPFTRQAASLAVTQQTHDGSPESANSTAASRIETPLPSLRPANDASTATRRGSAVHEALRFIDFSRPCDATDLHGQLEGLCAEGRLSQEQLEQVNIGDLCWLMETPPGQLLRTHAGQLRRELPFTWARAPDGLSSPDPLDRQIVRGRLDVLIPTDKGPVLVDYKTDHVWDEKLEQRVAQYRMQLHLYGEALKQVTGRQPVGAWLVFLHARQVRDVL
jgi:ATP-dependent helicase/nuclease subunit A